MAMRRLVRGLRHAGCPVIASYMLALGAKAQTEIYDPAGDFSACCGKTGMGGLGDVNGDGIDDFFASSPTLGGTIGISGKDGSTLWRTGSGQISELNGDLDLDGHDDLIAIVNAFSPSCVLFSSRSGASLRVFLLGQIASDIVA